MCKKIVNRIYFQIIVITITHAAISALLWFWMGAIALGLGFKDKNTWTVLDIFQSNVIPFIGLAITTPGRYFLSNNLVGTILPWIINSLLWACIIVLLYTWRKSKKYT